MVVVETIDFIEEQLQELADKNVAGVIDAAFGVLGKHESGCGLVGKVAVDDDVVLDVIERQFALRFTQGFEFAQVEARVSGEFAKVAQVDGGADVGIQEI